MPQPRNAVHLLILLLFSSSASGADKPVGCACGHHDGIAPPARPDPAEAVILRLAADRPGARRDFLAGGVAVGIVFTDVVEGTGAGFDDPATGRQRREVAEAAIRYATSLLDSDGAVEILFRESVVSLDDPRYRDALGWASAYYLYQDGAPAVPVSRSNIINGTDIYPGHPDGRITINFTYDFFYTPETASSSRYDLFDLVLHEFGHCLGISSFLTEDGSGRVVDGIERMGVFDLLLADATGDALIDPVTLTFQQDPAILRRDQGARFAGRSTASFRSTPLWLEPFPDLGSAMSHWDPTYTSVGIMRTFRPRGTSLRRYADFELRVLHDLGYIVAGVTPRPIRLTHRIDTVVLTGTATAEDGEAVAIAATADGTAQIDGDHWTASIAVGADGRGTSRLTFTVPGTQEDLPLTVTVDDVTEANL